MKKNLLSMMIIGGLALFAVGCSERADKEETEKTKEKEAPTEYDIGFDANSFEEAFNVFIAELGSDLRLEIDVETGSEQDAFLSPLTPSTAMLGAFHQSSGLMREVIVIGNGFSSNQESADYLLSIGTVIAITNPSLKPEERGTFLNETLHLNEVLIEKGSETATMGEIQYTLSADEEIGVRFVARHAKDD